jgi:hypothetical protein
MTATVASAPAAAPDLAAIKAKQQAMWASGDFAVVPPPAGVKSPLKSAAGLVVPSEYLETVVTR